jgi:hypothetical protein
MPVIRGFVLGSSEQSMGLPPILLVKVLRWSELSVAAGEEASTLSNKLVPASLGFGCASLPICRSPHGGERKMGAQTFNTACGISSSAARRRPRAAILSIFIAERRLL